MRQSLTLETERLILQPVKMEDAEFILELYNSPNFIKFIGDRNLRTVEDAENYIKEKFLPHVEKHGFGSYVIVTKSDTKKIGNVGIYVRDGLDAPDIGFSFLPEFERKGYGFEASKKLMEIAFSEFGLKKISAITTKENIASQKLIEKLGLKYLKIVQLPDDPEDLLYYETEN